MLTATTQTLLEIAPPEFPEYTPGLREALQHICEGAAFRTSPKSCEFLQHIVRHTLEGETDQLKERLIGMSLLGRDASYDTGSDAGGPRACERSPQTPRRPLLCLACAGRVFL